MGTKNNAVSALPRRIAIKKRLGEVKISKSFFIFITKSAVHKPLVYLIA